MKASETKFLPLIEGTKQYVVPLFQRAYSWEKKEWNVFWADLMWLCENDEPSSHFIGSMVTMPTVSVPEGVAKFLLIDGQQRLTTIYVLLSLLRDLAKSRGQDELAQEIQHTKLVNPYKKGGDFHKLLPTQVDRNAFNAVIAGEATSVDGPLARCYRFFEKEVKQSGIDVAVLDKVLSSRLSVVSIVLDPDDNPHLVFESLNAKGRPLTQADLLRNYFFMRVHTDEQQEVYSKYWEPMQAALGENLPECIRHYLMRNGKVIKQSDVYFDLKGRIADGDALRIMQDIAVFATYYSRFVNPDLEPDAGLRSVLWRLRRLEVTTAYPFLLNCFHDLAQGALDRDALLDILQTIENYIIRRFVCSLPSNPLQPTFVALYQQAQIEKLTGLADGVRRVLQSRGYPKDNAFFDALVTTRLYGPGDRQSRTKIILEQLEASAHHKEQVDLRDLTIEHVMPQSITKWWEQQLGDTWQEDHELLLNTLGNLTLTAYNSEMSNDPFPKKQARLSDSHVGLNAYFSDLARWDRDAIHKRSRALARLALNVWPYFGEERTPLLTVKDITGTTPEAVTILGQRFEVDTWRAVLERTIGTIADLEPSLFEMLARDYPRFVGQDPSRFRRSGDLGNGYYIEVNLSAKSIYQLCSQAVASIGLSGDDWRVEAG